MLRDRMIACTLCHSILLTPKQGTLFKQCAKFKFTALGNCL